MHCFLSARQIKPPYCFLVHFRKFIHIVTWSCFPSQLFEQRIADKFFTTGVGEDKVIIEMVYKKPEASSRRASESVLVQFIVRGISRAPSKKDMNAELKRRGQKQVCSAYHQTCFASDHEL